ncbi:MAG: hypothetical protein ACM3NQ_14840 [Bacteroidales bacterium]
MVHAELLAVATVLSYALAWVLGVPALVPILNTLPALPVLFVCLRAGRLRRAVVLMLVWAATLGAMATILSYRAPVQAGRLFLNGEAYRREMFFWVLTGVGAESNPSQFVPTHLLHAGLFCGLSVVSGSILSMPMGAVLMNYMGCFVGSLAGVSSRPLITVAAGWVPWSVIRVASFVVLGVVLAGPVLSRAGRFRYRLREHLPLVGIALAGLLTDIIIKASLAPGWHRLLKTLVGW